MITMIMMMLVVIIPGWNIEKAFGHRTSWLVDCPSLLLGVFVCLKEHDRETCYNYMLAVQMCTSVSWEIQKIVWSLVNKCS